MEVVSRGQASVGLHRLAAIAHWALVASLVLLASFLLMRMSGGNLSGAPPASLFIVVEIFIGLTLLGTRLSLNFSPERTTSRVAWFEYAVGLGVHVLAVTTWGLVSGSEFVFALCLLFALLVEFASSYLLFVSKPTQPILVHDLSGPVTEGSQIESLTVEGARGISETDLPGGSLNALEGGAGLEFGQSISVEGEIEEEAEWDENITQQMTRIRTERGTEQVVGLIREGIQKDQRMIVSHVVFHPPLDEPAAIKAHVVSGPSATIRATKNETFGARFEIKLQQVAEDHGHLVYEFIASPPHEENGINE